MGGRGSSRAGSAKYGASKVGSEHPKETEMRGPAEGVEGGAREPQCMARWVKTTQPPRGRGQARMDWTAASVLRATWRGSEAVGDGSSPEQEDEGEGDVVLGGRKVGVAIEGGGGCRKEGSVSSAWQRHVMCRLCVCMCVCMRVRVTGNVACTGCSGRGRARGYA